LKEAGVEPRLLIAGAVVQVPQTVEAMLWIFLTPSVADGALLLSAWVDLILLRHHCRIMGWRYSLAALQVCDCLCEG
jgi:hypothetical protein